MQQTRHNDPPFNRIEADTQYVNRVMFDSGGDFVISSGSQDHGLRLWNLNGELLQVLEKHGSEINDFSFSPDGEIIISADSSGRAILWNLNLGSLLSSSCSLLDSFLAQSDSSPQKNGDRRTKICKHD
jgi:WD40 repeat protein